MPDVLFCDEGSAFTRNKWDELAKENGVVLKFSDVQNHDGIILCERYRSPLKRIYRKILLDCPDIDKNLA